MESICIHTSNVAHIPGEVGIGGLNQEMVGSGWA